MARALPDDDEARSARADSGARGTRLPALPPPPPPAAEWALLLPPSASSAPFPAAAAAVEAWRCGSFPGPSGPVGSWSCIKCSLIPSSPAQLLKSIAAAVLLFFLLSAATSAAVASLTPCPPAVALLPPRPRTREDPRLPRPPLAAAPERAADLDRDAEAFEDDPTALAVRFTIVGNPEHVVW